MDAHNPLKMICQAPLAARKILVMRYRFIGDTILTVPFLRNLRYYYPDSQIDVLVGPESGKVLEGCPYINQLLPFDTTNFHKYDRGNGQKLSFLQQAKHLRERKYDLVFVLKRSFSSALLAWLSSAAHRVGWDTEYRRLFLTHPVPWNKHVHEVEALLDVLRAAGVEPIDDYLEAWVCQSEKEELLSLVPALGSSKPKVLFHAASAHPDKMYPLSSWAEVMKLLAQKHDFLPFFIGAAQDRQIYEQLQEMAGMAGVNLAGDLSLRQSIVLLSTLDLAVSTDSGPSHLAAAAGCRVVALFGPTDPVRWRPFGKLHKAVFDAQLPCRPCNYKKTCQGQRQCLSQLSARQVAAECGEMLQDIADGPKNLPLADPCPQS